MRFLVTGATGFVGKKLVETLSSDGHDVIALVRQKREDMPNDTRQLELEDLAQITEHAVDAKQLFSALRETDIVVHAAARAHVLNESVAEPLTVFRRINTEATVELARLAALAGVKRFIFISTIGVNGLTTKHKPFTEMDEPAPHSDYAVSKWEAEKGLTQLAAENGLQTVIIRPPLIYGPGAPGNFGKLVKWVRKGLPMPFASIENRRSFLALNNLCQFIALAATHPNAANETFLVSDRGYVSTSYLLKATADAFQVSLRLFYVPAKLFYYSTKLFNREHIYEQLWGSLEIDTSKASQKLGWQPSTTMIEQLRECFEEVCSHHDT